MVLLVSVRNVELLCCEIQLQLTDGARVREAGERSWRVGLHFNLTCQLKNDISIECAIIYSALRTFGGNGNFFDPTWRSDATFCFDVFPGFDNEDYAHPLIQTAAMSLRHKIALNCHRP